MKRSQQVHRQEQNMLGVPIHPSNNLVVVLSLICLLSCNLCFASSTSQGRSSSSSPKPSLPEVVSFPRQTPMIARKLQSWMIRQKAQTKSSQRMRRIIKVDHHDGNDKSSENASRGSFLTLQHPTKERIFDWYGVEEDPYHQNSMRCVISRMQFNHDKVGITNPFLHINGRQYNENAIDGRVQMDGSVENYDEEHRMLLHASQQKCKQTVPVSQVATRQRTSTIQQEDSASTISETEKLQNCWWPCLQESSTSSRGISKNKSKDEWRVLVYRKRVGRGKACYEKVRDAALDWEFETSNGAMGLVEVPATRPKGSLFRKKLKNQRHVAGATGRYFVRPIEKDETDTARPESSFYRSLGSSSRRLATFTSVPVGFKKKIYAINPVMVVYDLVDQRAPGSTFTSTAYSTLKGHWLTGEGRVSVALRDGTQDVDVEVVSVSRSSPSLWGKTVWRFVGKMQSTFYKEHLDHLAGIAATVPPETSTGMFVNDDNFGNCPTAFGDCPVRIQ